MRGDAIVRNPALASLTASPNSRGPTLCQHFVARHNSSQWKWKTQTIIKYGTYPVPIFSWVPPFQPHLTWVRSTISIVVSCELPWRHRETHPCNMATLGSEGWLSLNVTYMYCRPLTNIQPENKACANKMDSHFSAAQVFKRTSNFCHQIGDKDPRQERVWDHIPHHTIVFQLNQAQHLGLKTSSWSPTQPESVWPSDPTLIVPGLPLQTDQFTRWLAS